MEKPFNPEIVILFCQHTVAKGVTFVDSTRRFPGYTARWVMMPCSSKVEIGHLLKIFEQGPDGVQVVGCPDRQCRFLRGNTMAGKRVEEVNRLLGEIGYGTERVKMINKDQLTTDDLLHMAETQADSIRPLGPNPMKDKADDQAG